MSRWKLTIEYEGTGFFGWQRQAIEPSVQSVLETAIERFAGHPVTLQAAGRTDAGVHAIGQVAHVDLEKEYHDYEICNAINFHARPHAVIVKSAISVSDEFNARFHAVKRYYKYKIYNRKYPLAIGSNLAWHVYHHLDEIAMQQAALTLIGHHDFSSFRAAECQAKSPLKSMDSISVTRVNDEITVDFSAPSFLHHQVRNIIGTLKKIGEGTWPVSYMQDILHAKDRGAAGPTAPPHGLYFMRVDYNDNGNK